MLSFQNAAPLLITEAGLCKNLTAQTFADLFFPKNKTR